MSMSHSEKINCPECEKEFDFLVWDTINVNLNPEMKDKVKTGDLFDRVCPHCGKKNHVVYPFLYHDVEHKFMCHFCAPEDVESTVKQIKGIRSTRQ